MSNPRLLLALVLSLSLGACAVIDRRDRPAPVEDRTGAYGTSAPAALVTTPPGPVVSPPRQVSGARSRIGAPPVMQAPAETGGPVVTPYRPAETVAMATPPKPISSSASPAKTPASGLKPEYSPAAEALVEAADKAEREGDLDYAVVALERALRIEPRNPWLWNRLAWVRMQQRRFAEAADLAAKSNALAGSDKPLKRDNWQLVARAKRASGDAAGAIAAEARAVQFAP